MALSLKSVGYYAGRRLQKDLQETAKRTKMEERERIKNRVGDL